MRHYIIVKWKEGSDKKALSNEVKELYKNALLVNGVKSVEIKDNITNRDNRYDLMICLNIENNLLSDWDSSDFHKLWKEKYGGIIDKKCIFDSEM